MTGSGALRFANAPYGGDDWLGGGGCWQALTDNAASLTPHEMDAQFEAMMLRWAGVEGATAGSHWET